MFAEDFVFRGPVIGPLNKVDYLKTMDTFKVFRAFPDISPNAFGFSADPVDEGRVWFFCRNTGTNDGPWGLGYGLEAPPSGDTVSGVPEAFSVTFDADRKVRLLTVGYVADRFYPNGNTDGVGAAFGLLKVAGIPLPGGLAYRAAVALANRLPGAGAKSCSKREDVPQWWLDRSEERGMDGYTSDGLVRVDARVGALPRVVLVGVSSEPRRRRAATGSGAATGRSGSTINELSTTNDERATRQVYTPTIHKKKASRAESSLSVNLSATRGQLFLANKSKEAPTVVVRPLRSRCAVPRAHSRN